VPDQVWDWAAIGVVVLGAMMRLWGLGTQSMWYDELWSMLTASKAIPDIIKTSAGADLSPPLFYLAEAPMVRLMGKSEVAMRALPAIAGVATIWVVYLVGKRIFDARTGFWAATMFAVSFMPIKYAQEARAYSFLMLFAALGLLTLLRLADRPGWLNASLFGAALLALAYVHAYGLFGCAALVIAMLAIPQLRERTGWWGIGATAVAALLYVPWAFALLDQVRQVKSSVAQGTWHLKAPSDFLGSLWSIVDSFTPWPYPAVWASVVFAGLLAIGFHQGRKSAESVPPYPATMRYRMSPRDALLLLATAMVLPMIAGLLASMFVLPIQELRCFLVGLPAAYIIVAYGVTRHWRPLSYAILVLFVASAMVGIPAYYADRSKGYYREAVKYLLDNDAQSGRVIVSSAFVPTDINAYSVIEGYDKQFWLGSVDAYASGSALDNQIAPLLENQTSVYVVTAFVPFTNDQGQTTFDDSMNRQGGWKLAETQNFDDLPRVEHWVREASQQAPQSQPTTQTPQTSTPATPAPSAQTTPAP
jgi:mannosyltransferase